MIFPGTKAALAAAKAPCEANSLPPPHTTMRDPLLLAGVSTLLLAATALAYLYPAWRAASIDPMQSLRFE